MFSLFYFFVIWGDPVASATTYLLYNSMNVRRLSFLVIIVVETIRKLICSRWSFDHMYEHVGLGEIM